MLALFLLAAINYRSAPYTKRIFIKPSNKENRYFMIDLNHLILNHSQNYFLNHITKTNEMAMEKVWRNKMCIKMRIIKFVFELWKSRLLTRSELRLVGTSTQKDKKKNDFEKSDKEIKGRKVQCQKVNYNMWLTLQKHYK